jgi:hypothetical protein
MSYARLSKRPLLFRSFTGLEISEFNEIFTEIESRYSEHERERLSSMKRERKIGAGRRPFKLKARERLLMLLAYYKLYIIYTLSGFLFFDLDHRIYPLFQDHSKNKKLQWLIIIETLRWVLSQIDRSKQ